MKTTEQRDFHLLMVTEPGWALWDSSGGPASSSAINNIFNLPWNCLIGIKHIHLCSKHPTSHAKTQYCDSDLSQHPLELPSARC